MFRRRLTRIGALLVLAGACLGVWTSEAGAAEAPNDPFFEKQGYLQQIHIPEAWEWIEGKGKSLQPVTVAVVDTGVDQDHEDLKDQLVEGTNIIQPKQPPEDDYGHGTAVAGVISAVTNNGKGVAGIAPNVRIMPVKAVGSNGEGNEEHLGQGIKYAVDNGADIIVLSLGLNLYSSYMSEIVDYAESKGVLLVAATGNKGQSVMYPAAYSTVVAVGGASITNEYKTSSNYGPEVDLIAPWYVYTTANGGGYIYKEGTSMAAPQVAAVAALMLGAQPELTPAELRERLIQSAEPLRPMWNPYSGYGLLRADLALTITPKADMYEPNNSQAEAKAVSAIGITGGEISRRDDIDWFSITPPYKGDISFRVVGSEGQAVPLEMAVDRGTGQEAERFDLSDGKTARISSSGEPIVLSLRSLSPQGNGNVDKLAYTMETDFHIYTDPLEPNDKVYQAYTLPPQNGEVTGTFHQLDDQDWFAFRAAEPGTLRLKMETDTPRIDPELFVTDEAGGTQKVIDDGGEGETEISEPIPVQPGTYYLRARNVKSLYSLPVTGQYRLFFDYEKRLFDAFEPNNRSFQATSIALDRTYNGVFDSSKDEDWYQFRINRRSLVTIRITGIPTDRFIHYTLYNSQTKKEYSKTSPFGTTEMQMQHDLEPGVYYVRLMTDVQFQDKEYGLNVSGTELVAGFVDISNHWARESIELLAGQDIVHGYEDYRFSPGRPITRAEATALLARAFKWKPSSSPNPFSDVADNHWAKDVIAAANGEGVVRGYPDGLFRPNEPITRAEMAVMISLAAKKAGKQAAQTFSDVPSSHWAAAYIYAFADGGQLKGFKDGTFRPSAQATRAQFAEVLARVMK